MNTNQYIRDQVRKRVPVRRRSAPQATQVKSQSLMPKSNNERKAFVKTFLGSAVLLMAAVTMFGMIIKSVPARGQSRVVAQDSVFDERNDARSHNRINARSHNRIKSTDLRPEPTGDFMTRNDARRMLTSIDGRIDKMNSNMNVWLHRTWLLGLANNENAAIMKTLNQRYHGNADIGFISFDEQWRMNKMPQRMKLTQVQEEKIRNGPK